MLLVVKLVAQGMHLFENYARHITTKHEKALLEADDVPSMVATNRMTLTDTARATTRSEEQEKN